MPYVEVDKIAEAKPIPPREEKMFAAVYIYINYIKDPKTLSAWVSLTVPVPYTVSPRLRQSVSSPASPATTVSWSPCTSPTVTIWSSCFEPVPAIFDRTPEMGLGTELILVEGPSRDDTWEAIQRELRVMDSTALTLCMENRLPIHVFNMDDERNIERIVSGERVGTLVTT